jgi:hypothetical protein
MNALVRADSSSTRNDAHVFLPWPGLGSSVERLKPLAIPLTGAATLSVVLSLTAPIVAGAMFLIRIRKMMIVGADARMRKGREQELRARQKKFPLRDFSPRGNAY